MEGTKTLPGMAGAKKAADSFSQMLDESFDRLAETRVELNIGKIAELRDRLNQAETELLKKIRTGA
jgi:hypothetical protein